MARCANRPENEMAAAVADTLAARNPKLTEAVGPTEWIDWDYEVALWEREWLDWWEANH